MNVILANPWGLLGLLGIPALVVIHFLRRQAKVRTITTLFLLQHAQKETTAGRKFQHFTNSLPFWLQLLAVLLLTWLLVEPRFRTNEVVRQLVLVVDSSASMQAAKEGLADRVEEELGDLDHAFLIVLDHDPRRTRLYQGGDFGEVRKILEKWQPQDGALDPTAVLRIARSLVGPQGEVVYLTDHDGPSLPYAAERLALGASLVNVGFTGGQRVGDSSKWRALIRNYGDQPQSRTWILETPGRERSEPREVTVSPGRFLTLEGEFPAGHDRCVLRLSGDDFTYDDVLPLIMEQPKLVRLGSKDHLSVLHRKMGESFAHMKAVGEGEESDLLLAHWSGEGRPAGKRALIVDTTGDQEVKGAILLEEHPLVKGLNFQALDVRQARSLEVAQGEVVLVWQGDTPLVLLRQDDLSGVPQLIFTFSLEEGNALKLPATAVLLHRFGELVGQNLIAPARLSLESRQLIGPDLPRAVTAQGLKARTISSLDEAWDWQEVTWPGSAEQFRNTLRVPSEPGFFTITWQDEPLIEAAVTFADTREADLSRATTVSLPDQEQERVRRYSSADRFWRWFAFGVIMLTLAGWLAVTSSNRSLP